ASVELHMLTKESVQSWMPKVARSRQKYQVGYVVGLAGSPSMPGAALLSSLAALRGGSGIVRLFYPEGMEASLAASPYELIRESYVPEKLERLMAELQRASAIFVGPGIGKEPKMRKLIAQLLPQINKPCVLDADALNIIAEDKLTFPIH